MKEIQNECYTVDIIVPCYNEELLISVFYHTVQECMKNEGIYQFRYIFVDDGSRDKTLDGIRKLADKNGNISYLSFSRNFGKEAAIYAGLEYSASDFTVIMDADLQDSPDLLHDMLRVMEEGYDCCGVRRLDRKGESLIKSVLSNLFYRLMNRFSDVKIVNGARDFRMMTRQMREAVLQLTERERFSKGIFEWVGFRYKWLEYHNVPRNLGTSKWSIWKLIKYAMGGIISFSNAPLHMLMGSGAFIALFSVIFMLIKVFKVIFLGIDVHGYASTVVLICFFGGLNLFAIGLVGEYLARINSEVKRRPIYLLREKKIGNEQKEQK